VRKGHLFGDIGGPSTADTQSLPLLSGLAAAEDRQIATAVEIFHHSQAPFVCSFIRTIAALAVIGACSSF
jgi:hypothetical protein